MCESRCHRRQNEEEHSLEPASEPSRLDEKPREHRDGCLNENVASQRVAEKAGFTREGVLRAHTAFREGRRDSVLFSLLPSDLD